MTTPEPVFLTGGTGYLGRYLREIFTDRGWDVTLLSRSEDGVDLAPNERLVVGDVTEKETLDFDDHRTVAHLAAFTDVNESIENPSRSWGINADGTANVLECARESNVDRLLYVSSSRVYGRPEYLPIDETHPTNPLDPYASSKLAGDRLAFSYGSAYDLSVVVARPFNSFGQGQPDTNVAAVIVDQVQNAEQVKLRELSPSRDFLHASDTAAGLAQVLTEGESGEVYNIGRGDDTAVGRLAKIAVEVSNRDIPVVASGPDQRSNDVAIPRNVADSSKLRELGWEPKFSVREGLERLLNADA